MKFTINKSDIRNVLAKVQGLTGRRTNLAITENLLIKAADTGIHLTASDLETGFEGFYPATVESEGTIAIHAKKLFEIVRDFPANQIQMAEVENQWIEIGNEKIEYHIVGMNPEDFPEVPQAEEVSFFEMDALGLKRMIEQSIVIGGAADDKRPHINGVLFERLIEEETKRVRMVSTDGSRLSASDFVFEDEGEFAEEPGILIPKKGLNEVSKFLDSGGMVQLGVKESHFVVKKESETITIRLLEGDFPKYNDIIKKASGNQAKIERQRFLGMLKRMSILSSENYKGVIFNFTENLLRATTTNPDIGESKEEIEIEFSGDPLEVAFNPKYFMDSLNVIDEQNVVLHLVSEEAPCLVEGENDKNYLSVIMPMRI